MLKFLKKLFLPNKYNRHDWVESKLRDLDPGGILLDAGCGTQRYRRYCSHLNYNGQDFGKYEPKIEDSGLHQDEWIYGELDYKGDIWNIEENDEHFDAIMCTEVFEHIPYPNETINEFSRILKPGGKLILSAPYSSLPHFQPYFYYSGFSREWYEYILKKNNFKINEIVPNGNYFNFLVQENIRSIRLHKSILVKILYAIVSIPKIIFDQFTSFFSKNYTLTFGYQIYATKEEISN